MLAQYGSLLYRPIDISPGILESSSRALLADYPELTIRAIAAEYDTGLRRIAQSESSGARLFAWLGSSIGNLSHAAAVFLDHVRQDLRPCDRMLIGIDRRKDAATLQRAYDDERGITAEFNLNLLQTASRSTWSASASSWAARPDRLNPRSSVRLARKFAATTIAHDLRHAVASKQVGRLLDHIRDCAEPSMPARGPRRNRSPSRWRIASVVRSP